MGWIPSTDSFVPLSVAYKKGPLAFQCPFCDSLILAEDWNKLHSLCLSMLGLNPPHKRNQRVIEELLVEKVIRFK